jgi:hypothetical protein
MQNVIQNEQKPTNAKFINADDIFVRVSELLNPKAIDETYRLIERNLKIFSGQIKP